MKLLLHFLIAISFAAGVPKRDLQYRHMYQEAISGAEADPSPRIIGGQEAEPHSIPYQAFLEIYNTTFGWFCGGTLISQNYVLTAGHCCFYAEIAHVTLGAHDPFTLEDSQLFVSSENFTTHADYYEPKLVNDICVIKLPQSVTFTDAIQPVTLPSHADVDNTYEGVLARVSGWGLTDGQNQVLSEFLQYVDVYVMGNRQCEQTFGILWPSHLCTSGAQNKGSCNGDSGGPLVADGVQIAIVSFGVLECVRGYPSGLTRVTRFLDWIEENTDVIIN